MYPETKKTAASFHTWRSIGALALVVGGAFCVCLTGLAEAPFPEAMATRPVPWELSGEVPPEDGSGGLPPESLDPLGPISASWEGISSDFRYEPPDPHGAAGPNGIIQVVNVRVAYWDKQGNAIWGPTPMEGGGGFFSPAGNRFRSFDPRALYDRGSGRFYVVQIEEDDASQQSFINLAVSKTSHPVTRTESDWYFYRINNTRTVGTTKYWGDYPGLGFDSQAIYVTFNLYAFSGNNGDGQIAVLQKSAFLAGNTNYAFIHTSGGPAGGFTLQPCTVIGANSPSNIAYFAETPITSSTSVRVWALRDPLGARTLSSTNVTVPNHGGFITGAPQPGTTGTIPTLATRTQGNAFWYNGAIWFCHTAGGSSGKSRVYYYKVNLNNYPTGTPTLGESGFIDGGPGEWTYQVSIGGNSRGDVCVVYSQSSAARNPSIFAAIHPASASSFGTPVLVKASPGYYNGTRWGDYASVTADPIDDSFWVTHEWAKTKQSLAWSTWWAQLAAPAATPDGILEIAITPPNGSTLLAGTTERLFVQVTDAVAVTNASVVATVNGGTNLVFRNNGVAPDVLANDATYSANLGVPNATNDLTLDFLITAPGRTNSANVVSYSVVPVPVNDHFTNAIKVPSGGGVYLSNNKFATLENGEPQHAGVASVAASLWWSWSPVSTTEVFVDTTGSTVDTIVGVYQGLGVTNLTPVIVTNDVGGKPQAFVNFTAIGGASYRIAVASVNSNSSGSLRLLIAPDGSVDTNSPTVAVASPLHGQWVSNFLVTVSGTAQDPQPNASGVNRVFLTVNGQLPLLATGTTNWSSIFGLNPGLNRIFVTAEDIAGNVSAPVAIDVTYVIIDPANDLFANASSLTAVPEMVSANTTNATKEYEEPNHAGNSGGKSVWWWFQAPADGALALTTTNSTFDTLLGLYTGTNVRQLAALASNDDANASVPGGFSALTQAVRSNETYYVAVDGFDGASGTARLHYSFLPATLFTLTTSSAGGGQVTPASGDVVSNSTVVLTGIPDAFFAFDHWAIGDDILASANPLSFVVTSNASVTAHFRPVIFSDDFETGDLSRLSWSAAGDLPWVVQSDYTLAGTFAARSGDIGDGQSSSLVLTTNFLGGMGSFFFRVNSELDWDALTFHVDGVLQQRWSGRIFWTSYSFPLSAGTHALEWRYTKDSNLSSGLDSAFLDNVTLPIRVPIDASSPAYLQILRQANGSLLLQILGQTNQQYVIQGAIDLKSPIVWQNLSTNVATDGVIQYVDPGLGTNSLRFYRAIVPVP